MTVYTLNADPIQFAAKVPAPQEAEKVHEPQPAQTPPPQKVPDHGSRE